MRNRNVIPPPVVPRKVRLRKITKALDLSWRIAVSVLLLPFILISLRKMHPEKNSHD